MNPFQILRRKARRFYASIPARISALRYRLDHNHARFLAQTLKPIPATPPANRGTLIFFAHYDHQGLVDPYVRYYLEALHRTGATIILVSGSANLDPVSARSIEPFCAGIYARHTLSLDFGSWHLAWCLMRQQGWSLEHFDRLIIANDSVFGPLFPIEEMFATFTGADMYGSIESDEFARHLQSFFLAWDLNPRTRPFLADLWNNFRYIVDKQQLINTYEIGLSARARAAGLAIKPFITAAQVQALFPAAPTHEWATRFPGPSTNNTLYFYDLLIEHLRYPFLKAILPRCNEPWHDAMASLRPFIERHTLYPYHLIEDNSRRLACGPPSWIKPT